MEELEALSEEELFYLIDTHSLLYENIFKEEKKYQVHEIFKKRSLFGEYHHLFKDLKKHSKKFYDYTRMNLSTFNYILQKVTPMCEKNWCNLHNNPTGAEERLVVTLRYLTLALTFFFLLT